MVRLILKQLNTYKMLISSPPEVKTDDRKCYAALLTISEVLRLQKVPNIWKSLIFQAVLMKKIEVAAFVAAEDLITNN